LLYRIKEKIRLSLREGADIPFSTDAAPLEKKNLKKEREAGRGYHLASLTDPTAEKKILSNRARQGGERTSGGKAFPREALLLQGGMKIVGNSSWKGIKKRGNSKLRWGNSRPE